MNIQSVYRKKLTGTSLLFTLIIGAFLTVSTGAYAQFVGTRNTINVEGTLTAMSPTSLTVDTNGSGPITFQQTDKTVVQGNPTTGSQVKVVGRRDGANNIALVVRSQGGTSYGQAGQNVVVLDATVLSKTANSFTVQYDGTQVTFQVTGEDTGSAFVAKTVIKN